VVTVNGQIGQTAARPVGEESRAVREHVHSRSLTEMAKTVPFWDRLKKPQLVMNRPVLTVSAWDICMGFLVLSLVF